MTNESVVENQETVTTDEDLQLEADQDTVENSGKKKTPAVWLAVVSDLGGDVDLVKAASLKDLQELVKGLQLGTEVIEIYRAWPKAFKVKTTVSKKLEIG